MRSPILRTALPALVVACLCASPATSETPELPSVCAGIIVAVDGEVTVHGAKGRRGASEGHVLADGDSVVAMVGGKCSGFTPSGEAFSLEGPGQLTFSVRTDEGTRGRISDWIRVQLAQWIGERHRQPLITRSALRYWDVRIDAPCQLVPAPGGQVRHEGARLRWAGVVGVDAYLVQVVSETGDESERLVRGLVLTLDDLEPGQEYVWKVRPSIPERRGESSWRAFRVMTPEEERQLDTAVYETEDIEAGVLLLSAGLHEEALSRFDAAVTAGTRAQSARVWRARALADVGLYEDAYQDIIESRGNK